MTNREEDIPSFQASPTLDGLPPEAEEEEDVGEEEDEEDPLSPLSPPAQQRAQDGSFQDDQSCDEDAASETAELGEDRASELTRVQEVLKSIFEYYNVSGASTHSYQALTDPMLTSMRFQRMALDANLVDEKLTNAKVDLIFHRVCGSSPHMNLSQFLDAVVRLAATKYPNFPRSEGILRLYNAHLASFSGHNTGPFANLDAGVLDVVAAARPSLQTLYEGYFGAESRNAPQRRQSALHSETQGAFVQMLTDFEVLPELAPKSIAFAVFREVARVRDVPPNVRTHVLGRQGDGGPWVGRNFTYVHFAVAVTLMARRCFADAGASGLVRLFEWMDASKGRVAFASMHPGHLAGGTAHFRIMPEELPEAYLPIAQPQGRRSTLRASPSEPSIKRQSNQPNLSPQERRALADGLRGGSRAADHTGSDAGSPAVSEGLCENSVTSKTRRVALQIFGHYTAIGDPLNRTYLSTLKFVRFLRDCGLVSSEMPAGSFGSSHSGSLSFNPEPRRSSSASRLSTVNGHRAAAEGGGSAASRNSIQPSQRRTVQRGSGAAGSNSRDSVLFAVSASRRGSDLPGLPLRVFLVPPLTQVDADLIFLQATRGAAGGPSAPRQSVGGGSTRGSVAGVKRHHMTIENFLKALRDIAMRCLPEYSDKGLDPLEGLRERILDPLTDALGEVKGQDVASAGAALAEPNILRLFQDAQAGLEKIFAAYALDANSRRPYWVSETIARFAEDFELMAEINSLALQKIFCDCSHYDSCSAGKSGVANDELSFASFQLALVLIALKMHSAAHARTPKEKVTLLFTRMNITACTSKTMSVSFGSSRYEALLGGVPASEAKAVGAAAAAAAHQGTARASVKGGAPAASAPRPSGAQRVRQSVAEMSWAEVMAS